MARSVGEALVVWTRVVGLLGFTCDILVDDSETIGIEEQYKARFTLILKG